MEQRHIEINEITENKSHPLDRQEDGSIEDLKRMITRSLH
jgi:hypothetical protein